MSRIPKLSLNRSANLQHPYLVFPNPTDAERQIIEHTTKFSTSDPHNYAASGKADARYTFASGAHGCGARVDLMSAEYGDFLDLLKHRLNLLCPEGKPRPLVVRYGSGNHDKETCEAITHHLEGCYQHNHEARTITFYPKDGIDVLYVMELVNQYGHQMVLVRKEVVIDEFTARDLSATGIFQEVSDITGVPHVVNKKNRGIRFLCMDDDQTRYVTEELMCYKIAYALDSYK